MSNQNLTQEIIESLHVELNEDEDPNMAPWLWQIEPNWIFGETPAYITYKAGGRDFEGNFTDNAGPREANMVYRYYHWDEAGNWVGDNSHPDGSESLTKSCNIEIDSMLADIAEMLGDDAKNSVDREKLFKALYRKVDELDELRIPELSGYNLASTLLDSEIFAEDDKSSLDLIRQGRLYEAVVSLFEEGWCSFWWAGANHLLVCNEGRDSDAVRALHAVPTDRRSACNIPDGSGKRTYCSWVNPTADTVQEIAEKLTADAAAAKAEMICRMRGRILSQFEA